MLYEVITSKVAAEGFCLMRQAGDALGNVLHPRHIRVGELLHFFHFRTECRERLAVIVDVRVGGLGNLPDVLHGDDRGAERIGDIYGYGVEFRNVFGIFVNLFTGVVNGLYHDIDRAVDVRERLLGSFCQFANFVRSYNFV